jgi:hypoxanthine phosphoribosyltransferase
MSFLRIPDEQVTCRGEVFKRFIDQDTLQRRIYEMAQQIDAEYAGKKPILIGVLNGSFMFLADLMRYITIDCEVDFMKLSSYGEEKISSGNVKELKHTDAQLEGRHVLVIEDIVDTGLTVKYILDKMRTENPATLKMVTLLHKPDATHHEVQLDYVGFEIENKFVLGYGLDYGQLGRNLPEIYVLA